MELTLLNNQKNILENKDVDFEKDFRDFLDERIKIKKSLYVKVSLIGWIIGIVSFIVFVLAIAFLRPYKGVFDFVLVSSSFTRILGVCMFSIVPTSELDIVRTIVERDIFRQFFLIFVFCGWLSFGFVLIFGDSIIFYGKVGLILILIPSFSWDHFGSYGFF